MVASSFKVTPFVAQESLGDAACLTPTGWEEWPNADMSVCDTAAVTDFLSKETRSRVMARIRSRNTVPELMLRRGLHAAGARGWRCHAKHLPGKPDVVFTRWKIAVFVDGCFWHGHPDFFTPGKSGAYWDAKIARTKQRDAEANAALSQSGWSVIRFWDFEVEQDLSGCVDRVLRLLFDARARAVLA
jgi:DNA mismatch endonuclease, patch repair protein